MARYKHASRPDTRPSRETRSKTKEHQLTQNSVESVTSTASDPIDVEALTIPPDGIIRENDISKFLVDRKEEKFDPHHAIIVEPVDDGSGRVIAKYDMYLNNPGKHLMLLQYPNRDPGQPYSDKTCLKPLALRIKPKCGLIEVDVPIVTHSYFDKKKSIQYGEALRKSHVLQEGGSYGLSGGLRAGAGGGARLRPPNIEELSVAEPSLQALLDDFEDANNKGHVMNKLTLGGQIVPWKDGDPIYLIGAFRGNNVFLNKLDAMVQLRPQFTHLDALDDHEKPSVMLKSREISTVESEPRAVNLTVKSSGGGDDLDIYKEMSETAKQLKSLREEPWQQLSWVDSEDEISYKVFNDEMFIHGLTDTPPLVSTMTDEQWLDVISCPRIDPTNQGKKVFTMPKSDGESSVSDSSDGDDPDEKLSDVDGEEELKDDQRTKKK